MNIVKVSTENCQYIQVILFKQEKIDDTIAFEILNLIDYFVEKSKEEKK